MSISTLNLSALMALCLLVLLISAWVVKKKGKLQVPHYLILAFGAYSFFLLLGLIHQHQNATIDIKFQIYGFLFYLILINSDDFNWLRFLFTLNIVVFVTYILIYFGLLPSLWHGTDVGFRGRVYGPSIIPIVLIAFYYLYHGKPFDIHLGIAYLLASVYLILTTNLMNIVIAGAMFFLIVVNIRKFFRPQYLLIISILIGSMIMFFNSGLAPPLIKEKLPYVVKPWEYESLKIRIEDLNKALIAEDFNWAKILVGEGFGASTTIYRENEIARSFSKFYTFQEIDNGFYYLYHRGGILLLLIFIVSHVYLFLKIKRKKAKLGFAFIVFFTCLLSIHYFNNIFYLIIPFLILEGINKNSSEKHLQVG